MARLRPSLAQMSLPEFIFHSNGEEVPIKSLTPGCDLVHLGLTAAGTYSGLLFSTDSYTTNEIHDLQLLALERIGISQASDHDDMLNATSDQRAVAARCKKNSSVDVYCHNNGRLMQ